MPRFDLTPQEFERLLQLMTSGSVWIEYGSRQWKDYVELKYKIEDQAGKDKPTLHDRKK